MRPEGSRKDLTKTNVFEWPRRAWALVVRTLRTESRRGKGFTHGISETALPHGGASLPAGDPVPRQARPGLQPPEYPRSEGRAQRIPGTLRDPGLLPGGLESGLRRPDGALQ